MFVALVPTWEAVGDFKGGLAVRETEKGIILAREDRREPMGDPQRGRRSDDPKIKEAFA